MRFLVDAQLPPDLVLFLRSHGHEADHVSRLRLGSATDEAIWNHACATRSVLVTKDIDFRHLADGAAFGAPVVWVRLGNTRNAALREAFARVLPEIVAGIDAGEMLIELR
ncbi:DUF5615 family PIN-like protein [Antarcticirhabdus aurantiaca]|uniref:DUF5615 family PIN-like protein n=1 Tax=Antarcticirhabdus aurantiaca TaxID=2606717 RepID=A0ACD4NSQ0_9HYPH|nr:DUF5615 family PIN-like protein [Antarcticirhabdus aurantiaca]WAJ29793.1 DUF5615 family PIN-like protein [Jeongeuplla avenae]